MECWTVFDVVDGWTFGRVARSLFRSTALSALNCMYVCMYVFGLGVSGELRESGAVQQRPPVHHVHHLDAGHCGIFFPAVNVSPFFSIQPCRIASAMASSTVVS